MSRHFPIVATLAFSGLAGASVASAQGLPPTLPLNGTVSATTCVTNVNDPCDATPYPSPVTTSRFTLDQPSTVNFAIYGMGGYTPVIYLSGGDCDGTACGPDLAPGTYCVAVTASLESASGSCGDFVLAVQTLGGEVIFDGGFEG